MFKTIVLACSLLVPDNCLEFHDTRGPYETYKQCQTRAYEMGNAIMTLQGNEMRPKAFRCDKLVGTKL